MRIPPTPLSSSSSPVKLCTHDHAHQLAEFELRSIISSQEIKITLNISYTSMTVGAIIGNTPIVRSPIVAEAGILSVQPKYEMPNEDVMRGANGLGRAARGENQ